MNKKEAKERIEELRKKTEYFAKKYYESYEWAACDNAEKLVVACAGSWLICFKSSADEADAVLQSFKTLSGGTLFYDKAQINKG